MSLRTPAIAACLLLSLAACREDPDPAAIDQQTSLAYNGYACGGDCWQSYTAGMTGTLAAVQVWAALPADVTVTLYEGEGTTGRELASTATLFEQGDDRWLAALPTVPQEAGATYTVRMTAASDLNWIVGTYDYAAGVSSLYGAGADFGLTTYVR